MFKDKEKPKRQNKLKQLEFCPSSALEMDCLEVCVCVRRGGGKKSKHLNANSIWELKMVPLNSQRESDSNWLSL